MGRTISKTNSDSGTRVFGGTLTQFFLFFFFESVSMLLPTLEWLVALVTPGGPLPWPGPPGPTSGASHLLPECTVVTVVGLGLRSAPTPETPDEEDMKLQSVEGVRPVGGQRTQEVQSFRRTYSLPLPTARVCWGGGTNFEALDSKLLPTHRKTSARIPSLLRDSSSLLAST